MPLLEVQNLCVQLQTQRGPADAVRAVSFSLERGQTLGLIGESGCGKSITALSLMGLLPESAVLAGSIRFDRQELVGMDDGALQHLRGNRIGMIFQEPMTALNPLHTIGHQVAEPLRLHRGVSRSAGQQQAIALLERVGIADATRRINAYPHQFSGGQRQRITIAMALACGPDLLIADEPTTALDVTIQAQILELMLELKNKLGMSIIMITHDLGVIAEMCDEIIVMYAGRVCERGTAEEIFYNPCHEYTKGLLHSIPKITVGKEKLTPIAGSPIDLLNMPKGCAFVSRCDKAMKVCLDNPPEEVRINADHIASCWMNVKPVSGKTQEGESKQ